MKTFVVAALAALAFLSGCATTQPTQYGQKQRPPALKSAAAGTQSAVSQPAQQVMVSKALDPSTLSSLQPFKKFGKGEGHGVARVYKSRSKEQFVAILRNPALAKKKMKVSCEVLVRQMAEIYRLPFEGCEGAAAEIASNSDYQVVACTNAMFARDSLAVMGDGGKSWGAWHRTCLAGELVLTYKGRPILSTMCLNVVIPRMVVVAVPVAAPRAVGTCPRTLIADIWDYWKLPPWLQKEVDRLVKLAGGRDSKNKKHLPAYTGEAVSRTLDQDLRAYGTHAAIVPNLTVRYLDQGSGAVVRDFGTPMHTEPGVGKFTLPDDPTKYIVEADEWPQNLESPVQSRVLLFPKEWKDKQGRDICRMHLHGIAK